MRALAIAQEAELHPTYEEEKRLAFCRTHWPFFFSSPSSAADPKPGYIEVLWPRIDEFVELFDQTKDSDYFAAGKAMQAALKRANVAGPDWPKASKDEEIPF
jgi:hypothetical protein